MSKLLTGLKSSFVSKFIHINNTYEKMPHKTKFGHESYATSALNLWLNVMR